MDFIQAKLDWQDIIKDGASGILYTFKDWRKLETTDNSINIDGFHRRRVSPTYARVRVITLEGVVDNLSNTEAQNAIEYLQYIFRLQSNLSTLEERTLYIQDTFGNEWTLAVKVKDPIEFVEGDDSLRGSHWKWRVVLESTSAPEYLSLSEIVKTGQEGDFWWFTMNFELWNNGLAWDAITSIIECHASGNTASHTRFVITAINDINGPLNIYNITENTYFGLDISATAWDIIEINSEVLTATKNGINMLAYRTPGSIWQMITWQTKFIIKDLDGWIVSQDFSVQVYFKNSLL